MCTAIANYSVRNANLEMHAVTTLPALAVRLIAQLWNRGKIVRQGYGQACAASIDASSKCIPDFFCRFVANILYLYVLHQEVNCKLKASRYRENVYCSATRLLLGANQAAHLD